MLPELRKGDNCRNVYWVKVLIFTLKRAHGIFAEDKGVEICGQTDTPASNGLLGSKYGGKNQRIHVLGKGDRKMRKTREVAEIDTLSR